MWCFGCSFTRLHIKSLWTEQLMLVFYYKQNSVCPKSSSTQLPNTHTVFTLEVGIQPRSQGCVIVAVVQTFACVLLGFGEDR